ncbi:hypothetical protein QL996_02435 [Planococcus sp. APC 4015]|nr:hypothetical protein [Planococcus sp. APC 4015]
MSPRLAGVISIAVSVGIGIAAGWLIADPAWSIPAALLATVATVGMAVGVLWMLRPSWADKTWPPAGPDLPPDDRARRSARVMGIVLLAPLPLAFASLAWAIAEGSTRWERLFVLAMFVTAYGASGVWFLRSARASPADPDPSHTRRPAASRDENGDTPGWRSFSRPARGLLSATLIGPTIILVLIVPTQLLLILEDVPWGMLIWTVALVAAIVIGIFWLRRATPQIEIDVARERLRAGRHTRSWSELSRAELMAVPPWTGAARTLVLTLGDGVGLRAPVALRQKESLTLTDEETALLLRIIAASSIELPRDKEDPRGRFSKQLYPNALTKDQAHALVADPPGRNDPLPTAPLF